MAKTIKDELKSEYIKNKNKLTKVHLEQVAILRKIATEIRKAHSHFSLPEEKQIGTIYLGAEKLVNGVVTEIDITDKKGSIALTIESTDGDEYVNCEISECTYGIVSELIEYLLTEL